MTIKFFCTFICLNLLLISSQSFARTPSLASLNYSVNSVNSVNTVKKQNNTLKQQLKENKQQLEKQLKVNAQTNQTLLQLQQQLLELKTQQLTRQDNSLLYFLSSLGALALGLSVLALVLLRRKDKQLKTSQLITRIEQAETDISKLSGQTAQHYHAVESLKVTHSGLLEDFALKLKKLNNERKQSHERRLAVKKELHALLQLPITYTGNEGDRLVLHTMLAENNLNFVETLQAKSLVAEYKQQWQQAIIYWQTLLAENKDNTLALVHVAYSNYKLAERDRKDESHLSNAMSTYHYIMQLAPEYFEDINAYDDDENMGASELVNDPDKVIIYQQIEKLVMQVDELKNYYSIYNLVCQYAKEGNTEEARDWLEQISVDAHAFYCQHLRKEEDLESIRHFAWY